MTGFTTVKPITLTDAELIATDVAEADYAAYAGATTYALAARVIVVATHRIYESLQASNTGHDPTLAASSAWWSEVRPTNRWGCLDMTNSTVTTQATSAYYRFQPATNVNACFMLGLVNVSSVRVRQIHTTLGTVYDTTYDVSALPLSASWYDWYFGARADSAQVVALDLLPYPGMEVRFDFTGGADMEIGTLAIGYQTTFSLGAQYGAKVGIVDYSGKVTNEWGDIDLVVRAFAKTASFTLPIENTQLDAVQAHLSSLRATPCLYIGSSLYTSTQVFGIYQDFDILIEYFTHSACSINLLGFTE